MVCNPASVCHSRNRGLLELCLPGLDAPGYHPGSKCQSNYLRQKGNATRFLCSPMRMPPDALARNERVEAMPRCSADQSAAMLLPDRAQANRYRYYRRTGCFP
jgi:hypothetical protein